MPEPAFDVKCLGPYQWSGKDEEVIFTKPEGDLCGVYLWTIPFQGKYLVYYVGETRRSFCERSTEHMRDCLSGYYQIYDPELFAQGKKTLIWEGMWKKGYKNRAHVFLDRYLELAPRIKQFVELFRLFIIPFDGENRMRKRLEGALFNELKRQEGIVGEFQDLDIRYAPRRSDEESVEVSLNFSKEILGLSEKLMV